MRILLAGYSLEIIHDFAGLAAHLSTAESLVGSGRTERSIKKSGQIFFGHSGQLNRASLIACEVAQ